MSQHPRRCGCREYCELSRRHFLGLSGGAALAAAVPSWIPRLAFAASHSSDRDILISVFLRGGADGLTLCPPHGEDAYYALRPTLAVPRPDSSDPDRALDLDGFFGFPRAMEPLLAAYRAGDLLVVHACGLTDPTRSHFSAMHFMEVGQPQPPGSLATGWLGRHLATTPPLFDGAVLRAVGLGYGLQRTLVGAPATAPVRDLAAVDYGGNPGTLPERRAALERMYAAAAIDSMRIAAETTIATVDLLQQIDFAAYQPAGGAIYPEDDFGVALKSLAAPLKAEVGVETAAVDLGGWDTHDNQQPFAGTMYYTMSSLAGGLAAFHRDLAADDRRNVVVVVKSEFGRNAFENASRGTDHGHGGAMLLLGGHVAGGRVLAQWPGLAPEQLYEGQDLAVTIDYRDVLSEVATRRLGNPDFRNVFPDPAYTPVEHGVIRGS